MNVRKVVIGLLKSIFLRPWTNLHLFPLHVSPKQELIYSLGWKFVDLYGEGRWNMQ